MSIEWLVGLGAGLGTFVAAVMADDQRERLRNGAFGTIAGTFIGGVAAITSNSPSLVFTGVLGSAAGASAAWLVYLILAIVASQPRGRRLVEYQLRGLKGVTAQLSADENARLLAALTDWFANYCRWIDIQRERFVENRSSAIINELIGTAIEGWIRTSIDTFNLVLAALADKRNYRSRATVIVFGRNTEDQVEGRHWKPYSGTLAAHRNIPFDDKSIACQVLQGKLRSPFFTTSKSADKDAQNRSSFTYSSFMVMRINDSAVVSLDWPVELKEKDPFVQAIGETFHLDIVPAMRQLLEHWNGSLANAVGLT